MSSSAANEAKPSLLRRLGVFDFTLITIGAIIGSGIFRTPSVVAHRAQLPVIALGCWVAGGAIALFGAFVFAELAARRPLNGGLYAYLRDAFHPLVAFLFGWTLLMVSNTGGTAASAVLFAAYLQPLTGLTLDPRIVAVVTLAVLAGINILGVRQGSSWQNLLVVLKVGAIIGLIVAGLTAHPHHAMPLAQHVFPSSGTLLAAIGVAMLPVLFAYNGFQSPSYITAEAIQPERTIPRGLLYGICVVVVVYVLVNLGCLRVLGIDGLAASTAPAADVMRAWLGPIGSRLIAIAIALSTLGFMSTQMLLAPRIYYQMAADGTFFAPVAWINRKTRTPIVAILLQAAIASAIAVSGTFEQIVNWVVAPEWLFVVLAAIAIFIFRRRDAARPAPATRVPGHPYSTIFFILTLLGIFAAEVTIYPRDTMYGAVVLLVGAIVYFWRARRRDQGGA